MKQRNQARWRAGRVLCAGALGIVGCGGDAATPENGQAEAQALRAECVDQNTQLPTDAWECSAPRTVECSDGTGTADVETVYVRDSAAAGCGNQNVEVSARGPFTVGTHAIVVTGDNDAILCETRLTVTDTQAPTLTPRTMNLWPPNHKFHTIAVEDCVSVTDVCQNDLQAEFIWASSDEPVDARGDGHHSPDILFDNCNQVQLRAERQGPKDGRVYKLGVRVVDGAGNATESVCSIVVDHDQRGILGADSGESYRIAFDGQQGVPACDGVNEPPSPPPGDNGGGNTGGADGGGNDAGDNGGDETPPPPPPPPPPEVI